MPQLDPTWFASQLFWLVVCFTLLYVLLSRIILPPVRGTLEKRDSTISGDLAAAEQAKEKAERARQDYEHTLAQSREMAQGLMGEVLDENKAHAEKTMKALDIEIAKKLEEARVRINGKKHELFATLTPAAGEFAAAIAEKLTGQPASRERASSAVLDMIKSKGQL